MRQWQYSGGSAGQGAVSEAVPCLLIRNLATPPEGRTGERGRDKAFGLGSRNLCQPNLPVPLAKR